MNSDAPPLSSTPSSASSLRRLHHLRHHIRPQDCASPIPAGVDTKAPGFQHANGLTDLAWTEQIKWNSTVAWRVFRHAFGNPLLRFDPKVPRLSAAVPRLSAAGDEAPGLNIRSCKWLKYLYEKTTENDDWSVHGHPSDKWDKWSLAPMCSFPRFDLHESSYAILLMADQTPAWREVYSTITDKLATKYTTYWSAVDHLNQFGDDPTRKNYPFAWRGKLVPWGNFGKYNSPGWVGNGLGKFPDGTPEGIAVDPIAAESMLFFKGWLTLTMCAHSRISGEDKFFHEWQMAAVGGTTTTWTLDKVADQLATQWGQRECGLH
jgi:hypothetical protein